LIDQVFKKQDPLLTEKVHESPINFMIAYTNVQTGKVGYFSNRSSDDIFEALRATKAMPFVYGRAVNIDGQYYCDSLLSASPALLIDKAKKLGAEKILVLDNRTDPAVEANPIIKIGFDLWFHLRNSKFRKNYSAELKRLGNNHINVPLFYLRPSEKLKVTALTNDHLSLTHAVDRGYEDALKNTE